MAWILTGKNAVLEALNVLKYRMSHHVNVQGGALDINPLTAIKKNFQVLIQDPIFIVLLVLFLIVLWKLYCLKNENIKTQSFLALKISLFIIMLYPLVWYSILCNHSVVHFWFTYRELSISVFAISCIITVLFSEWQKKA